MGKNLKAGTIIALKGGLAAGKTTLVKGIALGLGIEEIVTSPTFTLIAEYQGRLPLFHMDLYRIETEEEFELIGGREIIGGSGVVVIEWSEKIEPLLPEQHAVVTISFTKNGKRNFEIKGLNI